jgi:hypothetical protein
MLIRQLVDAGTLSNLPGGLKSRGLRIKGDDTPIQPGEFRDVDVPSGSIRDNINRGSQVRTPGGTVMPKQPSNPDKIRVGQSGAGTYNSEKPGRVPNTARGQNNFNFGPKSQY